MLRQMRLNGDSDTPAIGARIRGTSCDTGYGKSFIVFKLEGRRKHRKADPQSPANDRQSQMNFI
jgi:hypothetical protein